MYPLQNIFFFFSVFKSIPSILYFIYQYFESRVSLLSVKVYKKIKKNSQLKSVIPTCIWIFLIILALLWFPWKIKKKYFQNLPYFNGFVFQSSVAKTKINNIKRKSTRTLYLLNRNKYYTLSILKYFFIIDNAFVHKALFSLTTNR